VGEEEALPWSSFGESIDDWFDVEIRGRVEDDVV
jgi:hypothetical protein